MFSVFLTSGLREFCDDFLKRDLVLDWYIFVWQFLLVIIYNDLETVAVIFCTLFEQ